VPAMTSQPSFLDTWMAGKTLDSIRGTLECGLALLSTYPWVLLAILVSTFILHRALSRPLNEKFWAHEELEVLGTPRQSPRLRKVVICGGGISGLMAAKMFTAHFEEVVLIDPEFSKVLSGKPKTRIMQYKSVHAFLILFAQGLRRLWSDFDEKLVEAGGFTLNGDYFAHIDGTYSPFDNLNDPKTFTLRRMHLEPLLHRLLVNDSEEVTKRLRVVDGMVKSLERAPGGNNIQAVHGKTTDGSAFKIDNPDLVIDSTGGVQCGTQWLPAAGFSSPAEARIEYNPNLRYMTITFDVSNELGALLPIPGDFERSSWVYTFVPNNKHEHRGFLLANMDNGTMQACYSCWGPGSLPKTTDNMMEYLQSLQTTVPIPDWLKETVQLLGENGNPQFEFAKMPPSSDLRYHLLNDLPENFAAIGDASMQLNPVFGHGCTKAMICILQLDSMLRKCTDGVLPPDFSRRYAETASERVMGIWSTTKAMDYGFSSTTPSAGETLAHGKSIRRFMGLVRTAGEEDPRIPLAVWRTRNFLTPPGGLTTPWMMFRLTLVVLNRRFRNALGFTSPAITIQNCNRP
jgi:hypothetical protein